MPRGTFVATETISEATLGNSTAEECVRIRENAIERLRRCMRDAGVTEFHIAQTYETASRLFQIMASGFPGSGSPCDGWSATLTAAAPQENVALLVGGPSDGKRLVFQQMLPNHIHTPGPTPSVSETLGTPSELPSDLGAPRNPETYTKMDIPRQRGDPVVYAHQGLERSQVFSILIRGYHPQTEAR